MKNCLSRTLVLAVATAAFVGCSNDEVTVSGRFVGLSAKVVYLEQMSASGHSIVDSVALADNGAYRFVIKDVAHTPSLYNILYSNDRLPLLVSRGEKIEVSAMGSALANYTVTGSRESELLRQFNKEFVEGQLELNKTILNYHSADDQTRKQLAQRYNAIYHDLKRKQISFIIENKASYTLSCNFRYYIHIIHPLFCRILFH